jgi:hypothetical protein
MTSEKAAHDDAVKLLLEIFNCPNVDACLTTGNAAHPCNGIVSSQKKPPECFQRPEPWSGELHNSKMLFMGSNPNITETEDFPTKDWPEHDVVDFFLNRYGGKWVSADLRPRLKNGGRSDVSRTWQGFVRVAQELLPSARIGKDFAITNLVHCKSSDEHGVKEAKDECAKLYLSKIISASLAKVVIVMGTPAKNIVMEVVCPEVKKYEQSRCMPKLIGGHERHFVFLPHPTARYMSSEEKTIRGKLTEHTVNMLRTTLCQ